MPTPGRFFGSHLGPDPQIGNFVQSAANTYAMAALNTGFCERFIATDTKDIKSYLCNFSTVSAAGTIECRIETVDATTGKPTGTLYDAAATKSFTPVAGLNTITFDSLPTTGLTPGTEYAVVLLTTTGGTTMTLRAYFTSGITQKMPVMALTAADGTTRSNFAEVNNSSPIGCFVMEDDTVDPMGLFPYATTASAANIFGTNAVALKIEVEGNVELAEVVAVIGRGGTPAGDLRLRIFDDSDNLISNSTVTHDKDSLVNSTGKRHSFAFGPTLPVLSTGTYRFVFDSAASANSSNCWSVLSAVPLNTAAAPSGYVISTTGDITATPPTWTDSATANQMSCNAYVNDITFTAGSGLVGNLLRSPLVG